jgi:hypothetical protein
MSSLSKEHRKLLENTVAAVRAIAVKGATTVLRDQLAVGEAAPWQHMLKDEKACRLRTELRAHGRQLGDRRDPQRNAQQLDHLIQACAYEHWHRMLFARYLAENDLLLDTEHGMAMSLDEIRELAREQQRDWQELAAELAQRMLLSVFRPEDPVLRVTLPQETRLELEAKLESLPAEVFTADDSLGWVYQFWQRDEKERVNKSEVKIGADELPAVTQLFTEDYMVHFLLENTLGAWWTTKRRAEGKDPALPGYTFTYLRLNEDRTPAAGGFEGWPQMAKELKVLDPCMGSGHFLAFALPILVRMRMEEEGLAIIDALTAVLKDNLFGLELDERCAQLGAFNLALTAWRMAGEHFAMPELNLACSGIGPNATKEQWIKLGEEIAASGGMPASTNLFNTEDSLLSEPVKRTMESLHELFSQAPVLGSLIDPSRIRVDLFQTDYKSVAPLLAAVLKAENASEETREQIIAAAGMVKAAALLTGKYTLVTTNVPYLGKQKQCETLANFCAKTYPDGKADLATCFVERCLLFCERAGSMALITPQNWLFLTSYKKLREKLLVQERWDVVARLGSRAFETITGEVVNIALLGMTRSRAEREHKIVGWDVASEGTPRAKALALRASPQIANQAEQLNHPDARIVLSKLAGGALLSNYAVAYWGQGTGDFPRFGRKFWEISVFGRSWAPLQSTVLTTLDSGGRDLVVYWEEGNGELMKLASELRAIEGNSGIRPTRGAEAWGNRGVCVSLMKDLYVTLYDGQIFDGNCAVIVPFDMRNLLPIWSFCKSTIFAESVRVIDQSLKVTNATLGKVPFDLESWARIADDEYPNGLPRPHSDDPTQWLFSGHPAGSDSPLQVVVARLAGYRWPRQTGSSFPDCPALDPDGLESFAAEDGIVPLGSIAGEASAADRLRALLAAAYGDEWAAAKLSGLLGDAPSLEDWLRDSFFEEHCQLFHQRPFVWHVWDGRKDGFHALVNYHKLAAPNGEGRKTLEKLIYTTLGDRWINNRLRADIADGVEGADGRLAAAEYLKAQLERILEGAPPYDIFVRWKPLDQQPIGWEPNISDGVRLNIRPWLAATLSPGTKPKKDACILRVTPKIKYGKDRGKEPERKKGDFPWFWTWDEKSDDFAGGEKFDGARWNDPHYSLAVKQKARDRKLVGERR